MHPVYYNDKGKSAIHEKGIDIRTSTVIAIGTSNIVVNINSIIVRIDNDSGFVSGIESRQFY
jgi:hypothetical protein